MDGVDAFHVMPQSWSCTSKSKSLVGTLVAHSPSLVGNVIFLDLKVLPDIRLGSRWHICVGCLWKMNWQSRQAVQNSSKLQEAFGILNGVDAFHVDPQGCSWLAISKRLVWTLVAYSPYPLANVVFLEIEVFPNIRPRSRRSICVGCLWKINLYFSTRHS